MIRNLKGKISAYGFGSKSETNVTTIWLRAAWFLIINAKEREEGVSSKVMEPDVVGEQVKDIE
ncbi:hypothetical protein DPMN_060516 [Dreissena polymorpha]|uniref:Uncharacterized protein n=1 Tax=Dreissena polymorpha TaxID=45954 RepID=A0A9D4C5Z7_DREPO|nr:hypothetical protein DPMN_060516 [Dreissena polymorpha]